MPRSVHRVLEKGATGPILGGKELDVNDFIGHFRLMFDVDMTITRLVTGLGLPDATMLRELSALRPVNRNEGRPICRHGPLSDGWQGVTEGRCGQQDECEPKDHFHKD